MSEASTHPTPARRALLVGAVFVSLSAVFVSLGLVRLVVRDEGFYLLAADLVMRGERPYLDFFYPQTPLLPYLYGAWLRLFGHTWVAARVFRTGILMYGKRPGLREVGRWLRQA